MRNKPNTTSKTKLKLWEIGEEICYKRKNIKQALTQVGIILDAIDGNWNVFGLQNRLKSTLNWDTYKGRTEYYDMACAMCDDNNKKAKYINPNPPKPVQQYTLDGKLIAEFPSVSVASKETGYSIAGISRCCNSIKDKANGFVWKFKNV